MNVYQNISSMTSGVENTGRESDSFGGSGSMAGSRGHFSRFFKKLISLFRSSPQSKSILRNQTNLPMFLMMALGLSLLCNFTLRENSAEASRPISAQATLEKVLHSVRQNPDDHELHSLLGELYYRERNFKRAMFHLAESSRLIERYAE